MLRRGRSGLECLPVLFDGLVQVEDSQVGLVQHDVDQAQVVVKQGGVVVSSAT